MAGQLRQRKTGQGTNPRLTSAVLTEGILGSRREQQLHLRLDELRKVLAEKTAEIQRLQVYANKTQDAIHKIETKLVRNFKQRLLAVAAEIISLRPILIPAVHAEGMLLDRFELKPSRKQTEGFAETLMAAGMNRKSANGFIFGITSKMGSNRLWLMEAYFNNVLSPELAQRLVDGKGNLVYGASCEYQEVVLPRKYQVTLTRTDVIAGKSGPTLSEEAKHKLRNAILSAVLVEVDLNMLFGKDSKTFDDLAKVIYDVMAVYAVEYRSNIRKGE